MDTKLISEVTSWMKTTDLAEFCYEKDGDSIEIKTCEALPEPTQFTCSLEAVSAPAIGIYHPARKGESLTLKEGQTLKEGDALGVVQSVGKTYPVTALTDGKLRIINVKEGDTVEYGFPLFFIEK